MGIKYVWTILTPFCERKPLYELQGKTVAIDLSCWICEAQNIAEYEVQPRMYLRNLYFRTCCLLLMDVTPVFVLEGKAPELKYQTISARNAIQFKGAKPKTDKVKTGKDRSRFHYVLRSCEEMLSFMGIACVKGQGEAESMCAYLNDEGLVDGCISQDSDCFAYGANVVYRNFSISNQGAYAASGGAVDIYDIKKAYESLNFGRNKIVTMALLCGSDYSDGVQGVGKESVLKFFETISDDEVLDRIRAWRIKNDLYDEYEKRISDKDICKSCGHHGKIQAHTKNGCGPCGTTKGCDPFKFKDERLRIKNELNMRNKALENPDFPNEELINEYLVKKDNVSELNISWQQPDMVRFMKFTQKFLQWEEIYSFEKILPILTRWQCLHHNSLQTNKQNKGILFPDRIKKVRNPKGVPSYEIVWSDPHDYFKGLVSENQILESRIDPEKLWSTIEPQILVDKAYPELVEAFKQSKIKPPKTSKRKKNQKVSENKENTSVTAPVVKKARKTKSTKNKNSEDNILDNLENSFKELNMETDKKKSATIDNFFKRAVLNNAQNFVQRQDTKENDEIYFDNQVIQTSTPSKSGENVNTNWSSFYDDEDDTDLSGIIEGIMARNPDFIQDLKKLNLSCIKDIRLPNDDNNSSFFVSNPVENDLFEKTFNELIHIDSGDSTEEYELDDIDKIVGEKEAECVADEQNFEEHQIIEDDRKTTAGQKIAEKDEMYDSFLGSDFSVPLIERLKMKNK